MPNEESRSGYSYEYMKNSWAQSDKAEQKAKERAKLPEPSNTRLQELVFALFVTAGVPAIVEVSQIIADKISAAVIANREKISTPPTSEDLEQMEHALSAVWEQVHLPVTDNDAGVGPLSQN